MNPPVLTNGGAAEGEQTLRPHAEQEGVGRRVVDAMVEQHGRARAEAVAQAFADAAEFGPVQADHGCVTSHRCGRTQSAQPRSGTMPEP